MLLKDTYSIKLLCDNQSNINLVNNAIFHYKTKHVKLQYHFTKKKVDENLIDLQYTYPLVNRVLTSLQSHSIGSSFEYLMKAIRVIFISKLAKEISLISLERNTSLYEENDRIKGEC
jgi:hypothetical protein